MLKVQYKPKVRNMTLDILLGFAHTWPTPLAREFFSTELHLKSAIEARLMRAFGAVNTPEV